VGPKLNDDKVQIRLKTFREEDFKGLTFSIFDRIKDQFMNRE
jgi:hypothetical protein